MLTTAESYAAIVAQRVTTERFRLAEQWLEENRSAIESYNEHVEEHGVFSDGVRGF